VNRPSNAFAALLVLLVGGIAAVSSSSRSTTVHRLPARAIAEPTCGSQCGTSLIAMRSATEMHCHQQPSVANAEDRIDTLCTDELVGEIDDSEALLTIVPIRIEVAAELADVEPFTEIDCSSHYDAAYDALIYGAAAEYAAAFQPQTQEREINRGIDSEELVSLFHTILSPARCTPTTIRYQLPTSLGL
jgi:hypothetical protein